MRGWSQTSAGTVLLVSFAKGVGVSRRDSGGGAVLPRGVDLCAWMWSKTSVRTLLLTQRDKAFSSTRAGCITRRLQNTERAGLLAALGVATYSRGAWVCITGQLPGKHVWLELSR